MKTKRILKKHKRGGSATRSRSRSRERNDSIVFTLNVIKNSGKITSINIQDKLLEIIIIVKNDNRGTFLDLYSFYNYTSTDRNKKRHLARAVLLKMLLYLIDEGFDDKTITHVNPVDLNNGFQLTGLQKEYVKMGFTKRVCRSLEHGCLEGTIRTNIDALRENINTQYNIHLIPNQST